MQPRYPEEANVRSQIVSAIFQRRRATGTRGDELVERYDSEHGHALARDIDLDIAGQIADHFQGTPEDLCRKVKARVPSAKPCRMNRKGMNSPEVRGQLRVGDIDNWGGKKLLSVASALGAKRVRVIIEW